MSVIATQLVDAFDTSSSMLISQFDNPLGVFPILKNALESQKIVNAGTLAAIRSTSGRPVNIPVITQSGAVLTSTRSCTIVGTKGNTENIVVSWVTIVGKARINPTEHVDNYISYANMLSSQIYEIRKAAYQAKETAIINAVIGAKSTTCTDPLFSAINQRIEVPFADFDRFYDYMKTAMELKDYYGTYTDYTNTATRTNLEFIKRQGGANATNLQPQLDGITSYRSNRLTPGAGVTERHFFMPNGAVAIVPWNFTSQLQRSVGSSNPMVLIPGADEWYTQADVDFGFNWDVHYKKTCSDTDLNGTRNAGNPSYVDDFEFSVDFAILTPHSSFAPTVTPILEGVLLS